ncbi:NAD(P)-dependent alcohol dehydrogenase [Shouchella clausii]|uniref:NAD(P)-dependent alcohol dehydrogenase n=1 Tax=Shouchella clausii TaxID=79880 RepID=UPI000BA5C363|nr:NAD(P)-dependent alcohol dehydrogenase [Shouchella clausii]MBX0321237.1 NAD(P)-dependent alcohol dehydrogenase [Shouchella clausii]PAE92674.1 hypothetical protein CHH70_14085 [Shouchella clausii]
MRASVLKALKTIELEERTKPEPGAGEVLIQMKAVGICGSDLHYYEHGRIGERVAKPPFVLGHECAGVVTKVGPEVADLNVGDHVVIEPGLPCGECSSCRVGHYNLCPKVLFLSSPPNDGVLMEYICHPAKFTYKMPEGLSFELASLAEPLSVGLYTAQKTSIQPGSNIVIMGMGPVGLCMILAAKWYGASNIVVTDIEPYRLEIAKKIGAMDTIQINHEADRAGLLAEADRLGGFDMVIDTSGAEAAFDMAVNLLKRGGTIGGIGFPGGAKSTIPLLKMMQREIVYQPIYRYRHTFKHALALLEKEQEAAQLLLTDFFPMSQISAAFDYAASNKDKSIKVIIHPDK